MKWRSKSFSIFSEEYKLNRALDQDIIFYKAAALCLLAAGFCLYINAILDNSLISELGGTSERSCYENKVYSAVINTWYDVFYYCECKIVCGV